MSLPPLDDLMQTPLEVWTFLWNEGGVDVKNYDESLVEDLRVTLDRTLAPSHLPPGPFEVALANSGVSVEQFLGSFFTAAQPYAEMMSELLTMFERAGAKTTRRNLLVQFRFSETLPPLAFDLEHFRKWLLRWQEIEASWLANVWSSKELWTLSKILRGTRSSTVDDVNAREWITLYFEAEKWPDFVPSAPRTGHSRLDAALGRAWTVWGAVVRASAAQGPDRKRLRERAFGQPDDYPSLDPEEDARRLWPVRLLGELDRDNWAGSFATDLYHRAEQLSNADDADQEQNAVSLAEILERFFAALPKAIVGGRALQKQIEEFLQLPLWKQRHELYSAWVFTRILDALEPTAPRVHLVEEELSFSFSGSHLATASVFEPALHVYAEMRSPLDNPRGKGRSKHIQPDYTILTDPLTDVRTSIIAIKCKQYLRADAARFSNALTDYAKGQPNAQIILVNYGPIHSRILDRVEDELRKRTQILGHMRPGHDGQLARDQFRELVRGAVKTRFGTLKGPPGPASATATTKTVAAKIVLTWGNLPADLDLHLRVSSGTDFEVNYRTGVSYENRGSIEAEPFVHLDHDDRNGNGTESIEVARVLATATYRCAVHNFSDEVPLGGSRAELRSISEAGTVQLVCPESGDGAWWLLFDWQPDTGRLIIFDQLVASPWSLKARSLTGLTDHKPKKAIVNRSCH